MKKRKGFVESFCDFMGEPEGLTREELVCELENHGIDVAGLEKRVAEVVIKGSGQRRLAWRERARGKRSTIQRFLDSRQIVIGAANLKNKVMQILEGFYGPEAASHAEAYFRKKERVSEKDLESLIEDLEALNLLEERDKEED